MLNSRFVPAVAIIVLSATVGHAQSVDINDDGWSTVETSDDKAMMADVNDDGVEMTEAPSADMAEPFKTADCTQLEMQMNMSGDECGKMSKGEIAASYIDAHD